MLRSKPYASSLSLAEIAFWCSRNGLDADKYLDAMRRTAVILDVSTSACESAGKSLQGLRETSAGMGLVDAIIYTQALASGLPLVTGDRHFKGLPNVEFVS